MPTEGGTTRKLRNAFWPQRRNSYRSRLRSNSIRTFSVERVGRAETIDLHRMIDHQIDGNERIDLLRIAAQPLHRAPHGRQIDHRRHAGEILQDDPGGLEGDFGPNDPRMSPGREIDHVLFRHRIAVAVPQHGFQQHADRIRQRMQIASSPRLPAGSADKCQFSPLWRQTYLGHEKDRA